jgi:hypothetical protein
MPIRPIPRNILPHTATLKHPTGTDARGKKTYAADVALSYVRFEIAKKTALTSLGEQKNDVGLLFFDEMNSLPTGAAFAKLDEIVINGQTLTVREVTPEYADDGTPHHQEIALV